jgi:IS1 family transposase/transposase-like protein
MFCPVCGNQGVRYGRNRNGTRRYFCRACFITYSEPRAEEPRPFSDRRLSMEKATVAIRLLMEGNSVRSICRTLHVGKHTLLELLLLVGTGCERVMDHYIIGVPCQSVQCDEVWSFVHCKEKTRQRKGYPAEEAGDCYTWTAIEPITKLILVYAVGKRDNATALTFVRKLRRATAGRFQINTDGLGIYRSTIPLAFGHGQDHAQVIKIFGAPPDGEARYSPPEIIDLHVEVGGGHPDLKTASTSHIERSNLTIRMGLRRFTRLTNGHSKSWRHHEAALGLFFAHYNFCRKHMTLGCTPAEQAGLIPHAWSLRQLIERAVPTVDEAVAS